MNQDVIIIGAGPAGMTAAMQLKRSGLNPFLVEKDRVGGALLNAGWVENYPGFPEGIAGKDLVKQFEEHLANLEIRVYPVTIKNLEQKDNWFILQSTEGNLRSRAVVVATGCLPKQLGIPGERELLGKSVFYEVRDVPDFRGGTACVIGGGDVAFDYALSLSQRKINVTIVIRTQQPNCLSLLQRRAEMSPEIQIIYNTEPTEFVPYKSSVEVHLRGAKSPVRFDLALIAAGREPNLSFIASNLKPEDPLTHPLYYAGDVINGSLRQVGIAVGDGLRCAMEIVRRISELS